MLGSIRLLFRHRVMATNVLNKRDREQLLRLGIGATETLKIEKSLASKKDPGMIFSYMAQGAAKPWSDGIIKKVVGTSVRGQSRDRMTGLLVELSRLFPKLHAKTQLKCVRLLVFENLRSAPRLLPQIISLYINHGHETIMTKRNVFNLLSELVGLPHYKWLSKDRCVAVNRAQTMLIEWANGANIDLLPDAYPLLAPPYIAREVDKAIALLELGYQKVEQYTKPRTLRTLKILRDVIARKESVDRLHNITQRGGRLKRLHKIAHDIEYASDIESAVRLFDDMRSEKITPNQQVWKALIYKAIDEQVLTVKGFKNSLYNMSTNDGLSPPIALFTKALRRLARQTDDCVSFLNLAKLEYGKVIDEPLWNCFLLKVFDFSGYQTALHAFNDGLGIFTTEAHLGRNMNTTWNLMMRLAANDKEEIERDTTFKLWRDATIPPNSQTLEILCIAAYNSLGRYWDEKEASQFAIDEFRLYAGLDEQVREERPTMQVSEKCWKSYFVLVGTKKDYELLTSSLKVMQSRGLLPSKDLLCCLIYYTSEMGDLNRLERLKYLLWEWVGTSNLPSEADITKYAYYARQATSSSLDSSRM
jgi:hypothetical protein